MLTQYFNREKQRFQAQPKAAAAFLSVGEYEQKELLEPTEMAAYAIVANAILNLANLRKRLRLRNWMGRISCCTLGNAIRFIHSK